MSDLPRSERPPATVHEPSRGWHSKTTVIAALSVVAIFAHLALRFAFRASVTTVQIPLLIILAIAVLATMGIFFEFDFLRFVI